MNDFNFKDKPISNITTKDIEELYDIKLDEGYETAQIPFYCKIKVHSFAGNFENYKCKKKHTSLPNTSTVEIA